MFMGIDFLDLRSTNLFVRSYLKKGVHDSRLSRLWKFVAYWERLELDAWQV